MKNMLEFSSTELLITYVISIPYLKKHITTRQLN